MAGPPVSSADAFAFAADFVEFERQQHIENGKQEGKRDEDLHEKVASDPKEIIGTADYGKFQRLSKRLAAEEAAEEENRKREAAQANALAAGCGHDHSKERQLFERPTLEKIQAADRFRREGNAAFKEQNFGLAAVNYRKALLQFDYTFPSTPEEEELFEKSKLPCHLNLAACKLQLRDFEEALQLDPKNCKAFYRRGMAQMMQDHLQEAQESFLAALEVEPTNPHVISALKELKTKKINYKKTSVDTYKRMFTSSPKQQHHQQQQHKQQEQQQHKQQPQQQEEDQHQQIRNQVPENDPSGENQHRIQQQPEEAAPEQQQQQQQTHQEQQPLQQPQQQGEAEHRERPQEPQQQQQPQQQEQQQPQQQEQQEEEHHGTEMSFADVQQTPANWAAVDVAASAATPAAAAQGEAPAAATAAAAAASAASAEDSSSNDWCCEADCPCSGASAASCTRGLGFDAQSALRLMREEGAPGGPPPFRGPQGPPMKAKEKKSGDLRAVALPVVAVGVAAGFVSLCCCCSRGDYLSPAVVAAVAAAAAAAETVGPWFVGFSLLLLLLLGCFLLIFDLNETTADSTCCCNNRSKYSRESTEREQQG